jgi:topoisomerase IV subunit A
MSNTSTLAVEGAERQPLKTFTEKAYLDYSMYVILDRVFMSPAISHKGLF